MLNLLSQIANTIIAIVSFFVHSIESFINLLLHLPAYVTFLTQSIAFLPAILIPFAAASISIYIVLMIVGRN